MADNVSYSVTEVPQLSPPQQQQKRRSSEPEVGGKKKAKTKHLTQKGQSKTAERGALRRHLALERQISRAQRTNSNGTSVVSPVPVVAPSSEPTAQEVLKTWSPPGETEQLDSSNPSSPASSPDHTPVRHSSDKAQENIWSAQFQAFMQDAFSQFMASKGQVAFHTPHKGRTRPPPTNISETSSQIGEGDSLDLDMSDMPLSEDEETAPEQAASSGLFNPALLKSLLIKAVSTVSLTSVQEEKPSTSKEANPLFAKKVPQDKYIPCPEVFMTTVEEQWSSLASPPVPNSVERKLFNLSPSFSNMLEVPTVDNPLISLFSTSAIPGDMAEVLKPEEKKFEHSLRRSHMAAAWAAKAATSSSFFARACIMWLRELQSTVPPDQVRVHQTLAKLLAASQFMADASLYATKYAARSIAATVASRRLLWLKNWKTDLRSKWRLSTSKYSGASLFGSILDPHVSEGRDKLAEEFWELKSTNLKVVKVADPCPSSFEGSRISLGKSLG